jgi:hypothetical protein
MIKVEGAANVNRKGQVFDFYKTTTHGWGFVPWGVILQSKICPSLFSDLSHADTDGVYLEEDVDFPLFEELFLKATGKRIVFHDIVDAEEEIRMKDSIKAYLVNLRKGN